MKSSYTEIIRKRGNNMEENEKKQDQELWTVAELEGGSHTWWYVCGECHGQIDWHTPTCPHCKRKVNWNG